MERQPQYSHHSPSLKAERPRVARPTERLEYSTPRELQTAAHELNHALLAHHLGVSVKTISVIPEGYSLGRVTFSGGLAVETFKLIAAGGAVNTVYGEARGYGMDLFMIKILTQRYGGMTDQEAISQARSILSTYNPKILKRAAEIMAFMKETSGAMLPYIMAQAKLELEQEEKQLVRQDQHQRDHLFMTESALRLREKNNVERNDNHEDVTIDIGPRYHRYTYISDKGIKETVVVCNGCNGLGGKHKPTCPVHQRRLGSTRRTIEKKTNIGANNAEEIPKQHQASTTSMSA